MNMNTFPRRHVVIDTETTSTDVYGDVPTKELRLMLGAAVVRDPDTYGEDTDVVWQFEQADEFHNRLDTLPVSKDPIYIFAHNMGFDVRISEFFRHLATGRYLLLPDSGMPNANRYKTPLFVAESPPFIVRLWRKDGQKLVLLDTYQWLKGSLAEIGEWIGFPKTTPPDDPNDYAAMMEYCVNDCNVLTHALRKLWGVLRKLNCRDFQPTPASQAMFTYKTRFEKKKIVRPQDPNDLRLDRWGYYGGRVECFRLGEIKGTTHQVDVNSLYPYVMSQNLFPCEAEEINMIEQQSKLRADDHFNRMTAEVYLESPDHDYPVRCSEGTLYVKGRVRTVLCGPELAAAHERGHIKYIGRHIIYRMHDLFTPYVNWLYRYRIWYKQHGDRLGDAVCKAMLASLHGKFGQREGEWQHAGRDHPSSFFGTGRAIGGNLSEDTEVRVLAGHTFLRQRDAEDKRGFVPVASWTASYGRALMDEVRAIIAPDNCYYQATDSLLVSEKCYKDMLADGAISDTEMGKFKLEGSSDTCRIHGPNQLDLGQSRRRSGIRKNAVNLCGEVYEQEDWEQASQGIYRGNVSSVFIRTITKHLRTGTRRRMRTPSGRTEAWSVDNWSVRPEDQKTLRLLSDAEHRE